MATAERQSLKENSWFPGFLIKLLCIAPDRVANKSLRGRQNSETLAAVLFPCTGKLQLQRNRPPP
jgi:hypothetical protein